MRGTTMRFLALAAVFALLLWSLPAAAAPSEDQAATRDSMRRTIEEFAASGDRTIATRGNQRAALMIQDRFEELGYQVGVQRFLVPKREHHGSRLSAGGQDVALSQLLYNAITPETLPPDGVDGPLVYVGSGSLTEMNGLPIEGAIVVMDFDSGKHWVNAAMLGAEALVLVDWDESSKGAFKAKRELTPIDFPILFATREQAGQGPLAAIKRGEPALLDHNAHLDSQMRWERVEGQNIWAYLPGSNPRLEEQLLVLEAFYDASTWVAGQAPGAEESASIAALLELAEHFAAEHPERSLLLVATDGHGEELAGMREFVWNVKVKALRLKEIERFERRRYTRAGSVIKALDTPDPLYALQSGFAPLVKEALDEQVKNEVDQLSTDLMRLRMSKQLDQNADLDERIEKLSALRLHYRRIAFSGDYAKLPPDQKQSVLKLVPQAIEEQQAIYDDAKLQYDVVRTGRELRGLVARHEVAAMVSLHLSSHGSGLGALDYGFMFDIRPDRDRTPAYALISRMLEGAARKIEAEQGLGDMYVDTLRPSRLRPWQTYFVDEPAMGGEVSALGNYLGFTLATLNDARPTWRTPYDTPDKIDYDALERQYRLVRGLADYMAHEPDYLFVELPRIGTSELVGQAEFIRQGELFPDRPAPGTMFQAYQGPAMYNLMADTGGRFRLVGICDKKNTFHKVVLEGYKFAPDNGQVLWAIDKNRTGKDRYRVKMNHLLEETKLVMFAARQITVFGLLEPRTFQYMTRIDVFDGRRETLPDRYWYSRIDTRESTLASFYLEPQTPLKMTLSESVLNRKLILSHGTPTDSEGEGYLPENWPLIHATPYRVAQDMWTLLGPRIDNLENHGIHNARVKELQAHGETLLSQARTSLSELRYSDFMEQARASWALASRVYNDVEGTQKDVLLGVLFYIALFVPFAYCLERIIFAFADIHKRIIAFTGILTATVGVIYFVHPAFQLTYSPLVVILAFFIVGLSVLVSSIIFLRFEKEMQNLQKRFRQGASEGISRARAFAAAFVIGVTNLRRRKIRTFLTCLTLVILTFTIMSFTAVKSVRSSGSVLFQEHSPYLGILMKHLSWGDLPPEALDIVKNSFAGKGLVGPRIWLENADRTTAAAVHLAPAGRPDQDEDARGLVGLGWDEPQISGIDKVLVGGRWFGSNEPDAVILPEPMARRLGVDPANPKEAVVQLWGMPFRVVGVFSPDRYEAFTDLDGEPLTPVTYPSETMIQLSEAEMDAMEAGDDVQSFQSRYQHVDPGLTIVVPASTAVTLGGKVKGFAIRPDDTALIPEMAANLVDRFGLTLFAGEPDGTFIFHASDSIDYSGVPNIVIPLAIAIFIVLNTMISSVYERKREIAVYTSVGMAPTHVSYLFIAEAVAFGVVSVVVGYLLAQIAASLLAGTPLWAGMTANYSSLAGVAAMTLVILVTLISVIYPSRVAGQIAIPDVSRSWSMPKDDTGEVTLVLPFLLKRPERECVAGFLLDYYHAHEDVTHGMFCTDDIACGFECPTSKLRSPRFKVEDQTIEANAQDECLTLKARIWLAPFDFGVKQRTTLVFCPAEDNPEFFEIRVHIERESGEISIWRRINKVFLNNLRKQLLIWRSLQADDQRSFETTLEKELARRQGYAMPV